jgi:hypothetical protein
LVITGVVQCVATMISYAASDRITSFYEPLLDAIHCLLATKPSQTARVCACLLHDAFLFASYTECVPCARRTIPSEVQVVMEVRVDCQWIIVNGY